jgi:type I restriction enzyme R subunit
MSDEFPIQLFDPAQEVSIVERRLPHWSQAGTICFITWRTWDSMPKSVLASWVSERRRYLRAHGINPDAANWKHRLDLLSPKVKSEFHRVSSERWHAELDRCHGACVLRNRELAQVVANSLHHFDGDRYLLLDFVVMPNHVHLLAAFPDEDSMLDQCDSWKHFTAKEINRQLARSGRFWQQDAFDHLLRTEWQFVYLRSYIADNPRRARLSAGEFIHYSNERV